MCILLGIANEQNKLQLIPLLHKLLKDVCQFDGLAQAFWAFCGVNALAESPCNGLARRDKIMNKQP
jgi:hypothetical protein